MKRTMAGIAAAALRELEQDDEHIAGPGRVADFTYGAQQGGKR